MAAHQDTSIEVDPAVWETADSDYASSGYDTSTASLSSSINEYVFENGRRYHTYFGIDKNPLPTDEKEQDRLDIQHEGLLMLLNRKLHLAPLRKPQRILDIGTGTGIWAIDIADEYPSAEVIGTDLSPIQPSWVPPNCKFEVDDAELDFTYRSDTFDFVHARNLAQGISNWPKLVSDIFRCTKPGGYFQLGDLSASIFSDDGTMADNNPIKVYFDVLIEAMNKMGRPPARIERMKKYLEDAGFVDIQTHSIKQPFGPWPREVALKQVGAMTLLNLETAFHSYGMAAFTRILGMNQQEALALCDGAYKASRNKNYHTYNYYFIVVGRKPEDDEGY